MDTQTANNNNNNNVERTDSQRSQNNGPRVSFNRDVHVKRIGSRPNDTQSYPSSINNTSSSTLHTSHTQPTPKLRRELPQDLSEEGILKEAALVLSQAERIKCTAESTSNDITGGRVNVKSRGRIERKVDDTTTQFNSLPTRKKAQKLIGRSVSDASAKKSKRPSIFNLFTSGSGGKKSDDLSQLPNENQENQIKRITRSKSDVGDTTKDARKLVRKRNNSENEELPAIITKKKAAPLSPIIENPPRETYFQQKDLAAALSKQQNDKIQIKQNQSDKIPISSSFLTKENLDLNTSKLSTGASTKETPFSSIVNRSHSSEDMHSSQQPPEKPPLTKGVTVDGIVKRLSMERYSPLPHLHGPAFSYTRPNDQIIYAQVVCDNDGSGKSKQTIHSSYNNISNLNNNNNHNNKIPSSNLSSHQVLSNDSENRYKEFDTVDSAPTTVPREYTKYNNSSHSNNNNILYRNIDRHERSHSPVQHLKSVSPSVKLPPEPGMYRKYNSLARNNSDEDEGIGFDSKREFEEPPIIPVIRDVVSPVRIQLDASYRGRADGTDERRFDPFPEINELSNRRKQLESRMFSRQISSTELKEPQNGYKERHFSPTAAERRDNHYSNNRYEREEDVDRHHVRSKSREREFRSTERDVPDKRYHQFGSREILNKYSPERSHLDLISPARDGTTTTKYVEETKYFHDGNDGYREQFKRETTVGLDGVPHTKESHTRKRLESPMRSPNEINLGYIEDSRDYSNGGHLEPNTSYFQEKYRQEFEPKSLDSQFSETMHMNRLSPEELAERLPSSHQYRTTKTTNHTNSSYNRHNKSQAPLPPISAAEKIVYKSDNFNTLTREKKQQRSFDKGDSGIENDYRKDSFNEDIHSRWKRRSTFDDIKASDLFLKRERQHSEQLHAKRYGYVFRERSIDDGSHFDPRLDKYPNNKNSTLKYRSSTSTADRMTPNNASADRNGTLKNEKKIGGLEKVKQLFTGSSKKKPDNLNKKEKDKYMIREDEMRLRYKEHKGSNRVFYEPREPKLSDIATRRRLSTPKASPLPKRTPSQKSSKSSSTSQLTIDNSPQKLGWFKSLDRLSRKNKSAQNSTKDTTTTTEEELSTIKPISNVSNHRSQQLLPQKAVIKSASPLRHTNVQKNLRFFGDTDLESNASVTKATILKQQKSRQPLLNSSLAKNQKYSQSAYDLNTMPRRPKPSMNNGTSTVDRKHRSASLHNLDEEEDDDQDIGHRYNGRHASRSSRHLHDISESASDNEPDRSIRHHDRSMSSANISNSTTLKSSRSTSLPHRQLQSPERTIDSRRSAAQQNGSRTQLNSSLLDDNRGRDRERFSRSPPLKDNSYEHQMLSQEFRSKPPTGPQKPARAIDRRKTISRERDRVHDSSGTEGDSSQQSQRSVVYLHATTVGAIPQPYILNSRRALSREELSTTTGTKSTQHQLQPMTRTVARSVSVSAPWKPKHLHEGYEINYSQNAEKQKTLPKQRKDRTSSLTRPRKYSSSKDDISSVRNSSLTSNSTATLPNRGGGGRDQRADLRKDTLTARYRNKRDTRLDIPPPPQPILSTGGGRRRWNE